MKSSKMYKSSELQGSIPGSGATYVDYSSVLSPDGDTLYSYNPESEVITIYDLTSSDGAGSFNQTVDSPIAVADLEGNVVALYASWQYAIYCR